LNRILINLPFHSLYNLELSVFYNQMPKAAPEQEYRNCSSQGN
jgi:hypothetical protein